MNVRPRLMPGRHFILSVALAIERREGERVRVCVRFTAIDRIRRGDTCSRFKSTPSHGVCSKFTAAAQFRAITAAYIKVKSTNNGEYINDLTTLRALISDGIAPLNPDFVIKSPFVAGTLGTESAMRGWRDVALMRVQRSKLLSRLPTCSVGSNNALANQRNVAQASTESIKN